MLTAGQTAVEKVIPRAILLGCVVDELERRGRRYGVAAVSGAAGLGVAVLVERVAS
jgi:acetyl-CoA C-acetyltransferase